MANESGPVHQSFVTQGGYRYAVAPLLMAAACAAGYLAQPDGHQPNGGTWFVPGSHRAASSSSVAWSAPSTGRSHAAEPAALNITPIACHIAGTAWQKTWTRACASGA